MADVLSITQEPCTVCGHRKGVHCTSGCTMLDCNCEVMLEELIDLDDVGDELDELDELDDLEDEA